MAKSASGVYEKNEALAGQTVYDPSTGQNVTYNDRGYFESARNPDTTGGSRAQHIDSVLSTDRNQYGGSVYDKTYLSDKALASIDNLRAQAERGEISWAYANWQANLLRSNYGYTGGDQGDQYIPTSTKDFLGIGSGSSGSSSGSFSGSSGGFLSGGAYSANDLSSYLNDMYKNYIQSQLSALESAYKQNLAELEANAEQIPKTYQTARNEAAAQNDLARQSFNEYAAARGLNSGTSGQAALANSAVLQSNMADISTQEANSLSENALQQQKLAIEYQNAAVQAQADGNYQLAQALYGEYVRQDEAAMQAAQLAQSQANWQAEFEASQQQYQDSLAAQQQEYAYDLATTMLNAGIMPDSSTLSAAGISSADAIAMRLSALSGTSGGGSGSSGGGSGTSGGGSGSSGGGSGSSGGGSGSSGGGSGSSGGGSGSSGGGSGSSGGGSGSSGGGSGSSGTQNTLVQMNSDYYRAFAQSVSAQLSAGKENAALGNVTSRWDELSDQQKQGIQTLLEKYGYQYNP